MKTLIIDVDRSGSRLYLEDNSELTVGVSERYCSLKYCPQDILDKVVSMVAKDSDIETIKIDTTGIGTSLYHNLLREFDNHNHRLGKVKVLGYSFIRI